MRFVSLALLVFLSVNASALDVHFNLTGKNSQAINVVLSGYDFEQAIVSTQTNFCDQDSMVTAWSDDTTSKLVVDGVEYLINADNSTSVWDPAVGTENKFYYSTFNFKDHATCEQVFKKAQACSSSAQGGLIQERDLNSAKLSFVTRAPNVDTSLSEVQLKMNFDQHIVELWTLNKAPGNSMFNSSSWELTGSGKF